MSILSEGYLREGRTNSGNPLASLAQGSKTSKRSPQIYACCWKIALGNDVGRRSKFSVKINFSSEQSKIWGGKKIPKVFHLIFINIL